jgi:hypothetical protein
MAYDPRRKAAFLDHLLSDTNEDIYARIDGLRDYLDTVDLDLYSNDDLAWMVVMFDHMATIGAEGRARIAAQLIANDLLSIQPRRTGLPSRPNRHRSVPWGRTARVTDTPS